MVLSLGLWLPAPSPTPPDPTRPAAIAAPKNATTGNSATTLLTQVRQVRSLSTQQAGQSAPVSIRGVVTDIPGWRNSFFVQDATAGISVNRTDHAEVHLGDRVEITGVSNPGLFAPVILASHVVVTGHGEPPPARRVAYADMAGGALDSQWIEVAGVVHSARAGKLFGRDIILLTLALGGGPVSVTLQDIAGLNRDTFTDATLRLRGVATTAYNEKRQFVGLGLLVPDRSEVEVIQAPKDDPFAEVATPVRELFQFGQTAHRLKVQGVATYQIPGHALYLQDGADGITILTASKELVPPGSIVEAVGFPASGDYAPRLEDGILRVDGIGPLVEPTRIRAKDALAITGQPDVDPPPYDQQLVQIEGTVVESHGEGGLQVWRIRQDNQLFEARMAVTPATRTNRLRGTGIGSILALTGICQVHLNTDHVPDSFSLLVRTPDDVVVLKPSPWWNLAHALLVIGLLAAEALFTILWVVLLRNRVRRQTSVISESEARFRNLAEHDVLTGLPNRLKLEDRIAETLDRCRAANQRAAIFTIDIDRFKQTNDTYGHLVGDECLKIAATRLRSVVRQADIIARTGGEEFTIVVGGLTGEESAKRIAAAILDLFHQPLELPGIHLDITVSVGGALYPDDGLDSETLRKRSDQALYEAKRTGRNRAIFANQALSDSKELSTTIETALREGRELNSFALCYQPIVDATGAIRRFEALLRSTDPRLSGIGPAQFIPVAEESGLIFPLGQWVMESACRQIAEWLNLGSYDRPVAINISGKELTHPGFADKVLQTLSQFHIEPRMLVLELTETTAMALMASVADTVAKLAAAGVAFAIDDFGTGYSSLSRLHELPIKTIKIDRSFVQLLQKNAGSYTIIKAIIQMAKSLAIEVVAEGVETEDQFQLLRELGCDCFQGYLFAKPLPPNRVLELLSQDNASLLPVAT